MVCSRAMSRRCARSRSSIIVLSMAAGRLKSLRFNSIHYYRAYGASFAHQRHGQNAAEAPTDCGNDDGVVMVFKQVRNRDNTTCKDRSRGSGVAAGWPRVSAAYGVGTLGINICKAHGPDQFAVERKEVRRVGATQLHGSPGYRIEHRLRVRVRLADHAQNFAGGRLLLERFLQALLELRLV